MEISFDKLYVGGKYFREELANLWKCNGVEGISKGVVTPKNQKCILIFITKQKSPYVTQYNDFISDWVLHMNGEEKHRSDKRLIESKINGDEVQLFYRDEARQPFIYYGKIELVNNIINNNDSPSRFVFKILNKQLFNF